MSSVGDTVSVLDLKPLSHNPFLDGTVVYENAGGVLVPQSVGGSIAPLGSNPILENRPSTASTQALIDSARQTTRTGVAIDDVALRGYRNVFGGLDTEKFGAAVDTMTDTQLDDFLQAVTDDLAASRQHAEAMRPRISAQQALRRGSQVAGALGLAIDAYTVADAIVDPTNNPADEIGDIAGSLLGGALGAPLGPGGALAGSLVGGWLGRQLGNLLQGDGRRARVDQLGPTPFNGGQCPVGYRVVVKALVTHPASRGSAQYATISGPINGFKETQSTSTGSDGKTYYSGYVELYARGAPVEFAGWGGPYTALAGYSGYDSPQTINYDVVSLERLDGQPDACGDAPGDLITTVTAPTCAPIPLERPDSRTPDPLPPSDPSPVPIDHPLPTGEPLPTLTREPVPVPTGEPVPDGGGGSGLDAPRVPDRLPDSRPDGGRELSPRVNPNPPLECCERNSHNLEQLLRDLEVLKAHFQVSY